MIYRREIDGLRSVAVVPVVLFHAGLPGFAGGYAGVDVFFVISGFLITTILIGDLDRDRFSIAHFYERRARRILPALALVALVTTIGAALTMPPPRLEEYGASLIATALFGANVYFWRSTDYFATAAEERPLLHMWSLAVEEQFYIVFPLVLLALWRWRRGRVDGVVWASFAGTALLSFGAAVILMGWKPSANFYLPVSRAWELLAGGAVALVLRGAPPAKTPAAPWLAGIGLSLTLAALIFIDDTTPWPGPWTILPVLGTALVLAFARADCPTGRLLGWGPMVWIGLLSYSIYLWHQPLLAFARITTPGHPPLALMAALAAATVPLAWISWRFVEQPFRKRASAGGMGRRTIFTASATAIAAMVAIGAAPLAVPGLSERIYTARLTPEELARYETVQEITDISRRLAFVDVSPGPCLRRFDTVTAEAEALLLECTGNGQRAILVTGGSHAIDVYAALALSSEAEVLLGFSRGNCRAHENLRGSQSPDCPFEALRDLAATHPERIALVVYVQAGFVLYEEGRTARSGDGLRSDLIEELATYLAGLAADVPVLALGPRPFLGVDPRRLSVAEPLAPQIAAAQHPGIAEAMAATDLRMTEIMERRGIPFLPQAHAIAIDLPREALVDGQLTYRDADHWSGQGGRIFGARLVEALGDAGYGTLFPPRGAPID